MMLRSIQPAAILLLVVGLTTHGAGQKITSADVAAKMSGSWKQDFSSTQRKVVRIWNIDGNDHLVLAVRVESLTFNSTESRAVFDRQ
jgi:hypothetical protein